MTRRYRTLYVWNPTPGQPQKLAWIIDETLEHLELHKGDLVGVQVTTPGTAAIITYYGRDSSYPE